MSSTWLGPNVGDKLRSDVEKAVLALAKARHAATGAPVMLSLEFEYFGFNTHNDPSIHRQGEYNNFMRMIDETRPGRIRRSDGQARQAGRGSPNASQRRHPKSPKGPPAILRGAGTNIPQGWIIGPHKSLPEAQE
jgi:hypothetical protein